MDDIDGTHLEETQGDHSLEGDALKGTTGDPCTEGLGQDIHRDQEEEEFVFDDSKTEFESNKRQLMPDFQYEDHTVPQGHSHGAR